MIHIFEVYQTTAEQKKLNKKEKTNNIKHVNCMLQGWSETGLWGIWFDFLKNREKLRKIFSSNFEVPILLEV